MEWEPEEINGDFITAVSIGTPQVKSEEASIHELGVSLMQYWIALLAIAVVFVMVLLAYVVIREVVPITEVNELLEKIAKGEITPEDAQKLLGTYKDEDLGQVVRETPGKEQGEIFAIVLVLLVLEIMYDSCLFMEYLKAGTNNFSHLHLPWHF